MQVKTIGKRLHSLPIQAENVFIFTYLKVERNEETEIFKKRKPEGERERQTEREIVLAYTHTQVSTVVLGLDVL